MEVKSHCKTCTCFSRNRCNFTHRATEHHFPDGPEWDWHREHNQQMDGARCINVDCNGRPHRFRATTGRKGRVEG